MREFYVNIIHEYSEKEGCVKIWTWTTPPNPYFDGVIKLIKISVEHFNWIGNDARDCGDTKELQGKALAVLRKFRAY